MLRVFLDKDVDALKNYSGYPKILGTPDSYTVQEDDVFVIAIANIISRKRCVDLLEAKGGNFFNLTHPTATIAQNTIIGKGCIVSRQCIISNDVMIGDFVLFNSKVMVGHDVTISNFCTINAGAFIGGNAYLEVGVTLHTYAIATPNIKIGENAIVGAGSVAIGNVPGNVTVFGVPAKRIF